jgi:hypothetical protein
MTSLMIRILCGDQPGTNACICHVYRIKAGWLEPHYKERADAIRLAARSRVDENGIVQGACGSPSFDKSGTSTEAQSFFLMMESAFHSL